MRVMTWNTYQATTMPYRHMRRPGLYPALDYISHHRVDVLCLQEQNSTRFGPVMYCIWRLALLFPAVYNSFAMEVIEYLAVAEGLLLPVFVADNKAHLIAYCREHTRFVHAVTIPPPRYFFDSGLIILSAHPIDLSSVHQIHLRRDAGNRPGLLAANIRVQPPAPAQPFTVRLYDVHFVPSLLDVTPVFRTLNAINRVLGRDTRALRREHFAVMMADIAQWHRRDPALLVIVAGDLNISRGSAEEEGFMRLMKDTAGLHAVTMRPLRATACERTFGHEGQIDYILVDDRVMQRWRAFPGDRTKPPALGCECKGDGQKCVYRNVEHVWPVHEADVLHSTRIDTMFSSDHYPLVTDLSFLSQQ